LNDSTAAGGWTPTYFWVCPQGRRIERGYGSFHRRFVLPDTVDGEKVNATGKNGVLTVTIPKQAKAMPRRIQIGG